MVPLVEVGYVKQCRFSFTTTKCFAIMLLAKARDNYMIDYLKGTLETKSPAIAVVECAGVGYECFIPLSTYDRLPATGSDVKLFTCHVVREDAQTLYGFATEDEKKTFALMTSVSGVGPKLALAVLSGLTVGDLQLAIAEGDSKRLAAVKGIGKKTAERIVVELKDKVNPIEALAGSKASAGDAARGMVLRDAMLALAALGFSEEIARAQVQRVLEAEPAIADAETLIRRALAGK